MGTELTCPFCGSVVSVPRQEGVVYRCDENGGTCVQTGYVLSLITTGENIPEQTALMSLYEELSSFTWEQLMDGHPNAPDCEYGRHGFILPDGTVTMELTSKVQWGVDFMRLKESELVEEETPEPTF